MLVYSVIAVLSFLENWLPPLPADAAIAIGAFVSRDGGVSPLGIFLATWVPNVAGAMSVWAVSRRYGRTFFSSRLGQRLFSARALHFVEIEFARYAGLGLFVVRFLPGVRAVAAPFAGMANVSFVRALVPMATASALWYGGLTFFGAWIGREWERITAWLGAHRSLVVVAGIVVIAAAAAVVVRRRRMAVGPGEGPDE